MICSASHTAAGVMRPRWSLEELQRMELADLRFSAQEGQVIRRALDDQATDGEQVTSAFRLGER